MTTPPTPDSDPQARRATRAWLRLVPVLILAAGVLVSLVADVLFIKPVFREARFHLEPDVQTLIVGASHAACAFDPKVFGQAASVARHGELMLSTHAKLAALLDDNPAVRTVLLAFSPVHLGAWQDEHLFGGNAASRAQLMDYYPLYDELTRARLPLANPDVLLASLKYDFGVPFDYTGDTGLFVRHSLGRLEPGHYRFWGGYTPLDGTHLSPALVERVLQKYFGDDDEPAGVSELAVDSLMRMLGLARERGLRMLLVDTPVHGSFRALVPERFRSHHAAVLDEVARRFPEVQILRHGALDLPDESFLDPDHLNRAGGRAYSELLREQLDEIR
jgi:hypothetical protein